MEVKLLVTKTRQDAVLPGYPHGPNEDAGVDLTYCGSQAVSLAPGARHLFSTGIAMQLPPGFEGQIRPRSGLALKKGITVLNSPGTIAPGYRGEIGILLVNLSVETQMIEPGERIAQLVVAPCATIAFREVDTLDDSKRGEGGFGSTGS